MTRSFIWTMAASLAIALTVLAAGCGGGQEDTSPTPVPWSPLPADGKCQSGLVLQAGESCEVDYSYRIGTKISADGVTPILENFGGEFYVNSEGVGHFGDLEGSSIRRTLDTGNAVISFFAYAQSDGTFYIEEVPVAEGRSEAPSSQANVDMCHVGMDLVAGESCSLLGGEFTVKADGTGCAFGSICAGTGININNLSAEKNPDGTWTIKSLP